MNKEEAIKQIRAAMPYMWKETKDALVAVIPELTESENERIYNLIYSSIKNEIPIASPKNKEFALAYLERQKTQKPSEQKYEGEKLHDIVIEELGKYNGDNYWKSPWAIDSTGLQYPLYFANLGAKWQKEQTPSEWSEEDKEMKSNIILTLQYMLENHTLDEGLKKIIGDEINWLKS